ncbi:ACT domain-containing protein [Nocardioidaceae bacterium]|nr:ACT domain-containing protein [Nocardioidaceae bacterium]
MPFLLRVELPDVPGSLGRVATAIGEAGGDIDAIEIVEKRGGGLVVDDVLLETVPGVMPDSIVSACNLLDGVRVLWISRYAAGGQIFLDLEAVEEMSADPASAVERLVDLTPVTYRADWAVLLHRRDGIVHRTPTAPEQWPADFTWPSLDGGGTLQLPAGWDDLVAAAATVDDDHLVVLVRRGGPEILDGEIVRFRHLTTLAASLARQG